MPPSIEALAMAGADYLKYGITLKELDRNDSESPPSHLLVDAYQSDMDFFNSLSQTPSNSLSQRGCNVEYHNEERKDAGHQLKRFEEVKSNHEKRAVDTRKISMDIWIAKKLLTQPPWGDPVDEDEFEAWILHDELPRRLHKCMREYVPSSMSSNDMLYREIWSEVFQAVKNYIAFAKELGCNIPRHLGKWIM